MRRSNTELPCLSSVRSANIITVEVLRSRVPRVLLGYSSRLVGTHQMTTRSTLLVVRVL